MPNARQKKAGLSRYRAKFARAIKKKFLRENPQEEEE